MTKQPTLRAHQERLCFLSPTTISPKFAMQEPEPPMETFSSSLMPTLSFRKICYGGCQAISDPACIGGSPDTDYQPVRFTLRLYLQLWRILGKLTGMAQGATQFCRLSIYVSLGGYDERLYMGEDVDFYWRLKRTAKEDDKKVCFLSDLRVIPSCRRFNQWPVWKTLVWTNPIVILLLRRRRGAWRD